MDYTNLKNNVVIPKIREYGKAVILRTPGSAVGWTKSFDGGSGRYKWTLIAAPYTVTYIDPATSTTDVACYAVQLKYEAAEIDGTVIKSDDVKMILAEATPTLQSKLVVGSIVYTIVSIKSTEPGSTVLLYTLQCRL